MRPATVREHRGGVAPHAGEAGALERCVPEAVLERLRIPVDQRREIRLDNIGAHAELVVARRARELHVPRSEEHTSELHHGYISYAVFCLKKKKKNKRK